MKLTFILLAILVTSVAAASQTMPKLITSELPLYPSDARAARIQGTVKLWFEIDSHGKVSLAEATSGHPLLRQAAIRNVRTWRFQAQDARAGKYETEFVYLLLSESSETPRVTVSTSDFRRVEITSELQMFPYTESYEPRLDLSEPLRVYVTRCEVDGTDIPCEQVLIDLLHNDKIITPKKFRSGKLQGFIVPKKLRKLQNSETVGVWVTTPKGRFVLPNFYAGYLKGSWEIVVAHEPFPEQWKYLSNGAHPCIGIVFIPWTEPGLIFYQACSTDIADESVVPLGLSIDCRDQNPAFRAGLHSDYVYGTRPCSEPSKAITN